jgi:hypothetical protein
MKYNRTPHYLSNFSKSRYSMSIKHHFRASNPAHSYRIVVFDSRENHKSMTKHINQKGLTCTIVENNFSISGDWMAFCGRPAEYYHDIGMFHALAHAIQGSYSVSWHAIHGRPAREKIMFDLATDVDMEFAAMWVNSLLNGLSGEHELS